MVAYTYLHDVDSLFQGIPEDIHKETLYLWIQFEMYRCTMIYGMDYCC